MNEDPKENMCHIVFICMHSDETACAHFKETDTWVCGYADAFGCNSAVARVNAMVIELKRHGIDHQNRELIKKIGTLLQQSLDSGHGLRPVEEAMDLITGFL